MLRMRSRGRVKPWTVRAPGWHTIDLLNSIRHFEKLFDTSAIRKAADLLEGKREPYLASNVSSLILSRAPYGSGT